ncbi:centrosomal protein of 104 kDa isoform X2 [Condylostylus longicornis]|uniref:centrosomal protein of 104 kDa isoform X2 n=1 Tax=Condylostylus longicornis TaxID=2530218 RepID=UPI00244E0F02|nr:centrosomal protein of 104 kDa isoform X2 [Condylostylus longicornis]
MARKISFNVVFASDEDPSFPSSELNSHGPSVHGWRSLPGSTITPHDIVLRFHKPAQICRIQVLAHQYLIPQKIELWLHYSPKSIPSTPSSQYFDFLGFIALSDNSATNYKSRELQSVTVTPRKGTHLKLRLSSPHPNHLNTENQIGLIAVNVLGTTIELPPPSTSTTSSVLPITTSTSTSGTTSNTTTTTAIGGNNLDTNNDTITNNSNNTTQLNSQSQNAPAPIEIPISDTGEPILASICDDLLFSMYVEESIADIIREMEIKKSKAVNDERFEYARKLKLCMTALKIAGERLGRYSLAKRQAVQQEDFTTAKLRKEQIQMYRNSVLKHLQVDILLEKSGQQNTDNDQACEIYASKPTLPSPPSLQDVATALSEAHYTATLSPRSIQDDKLSIDGGSIGGLTSGIIVGSDTTTNHSTITGIRKSHDDIPSSPRLNSIGRSPSRGMSPMSSHQGSLRRRNKSAPRNSYEDYEERAIPTLRQECQGAALIENDRGRSRLNDRERRQAALPILIFGTDLVEQFYSRQFQDREDGLARLRSWLKGKEGDCSSGPNKIARSAALLLHRAVRDAVYSVFSQATETVRALFLEFVPGRVSASEVARCVDRLLPELLAKSGDPSARIHTLAQHTILSIAACPEVREQHLVAPALSRTVGSGTHPRLALSRMQMLEQLVLSQGISTDKHSGLTCRALSECGCSGIHHPAEPVRKVAERILLLVYKVNPRLVRKQLPPDDDITRRNLLYRQLFTEFDKLDMQRKKEMLEANKTIVGLNDPMSPSSHKSDKDRGSPFSSTNGEGKSSMRNVHYDSHQSTRTPEPHSSPMRRSETRILKSKSGTSLHGNNGIDSNGVNTPARACNGKQDIYSDKIKKSLTNSERSSNSNSESLEDSDVIRCPFCNWSCHGDQTQLDKHYWKVCPFLTKCPQCSQVLEVAALNYHLTNECEAKNSYVTCERCTESVHKQLMDLHMMEDYCRELKTGAARCPLCHDDVNLPLDGGWKLHLLTSSGCPGNARRRSKM